MYVLVCQCVSELSRRLVVVVYVQCVVWYLALGLGYARIIKFFSNNIS